MSLRETITLHNTLEVEGQPVVRMTADISSDLNSQINYTITVIDYDEYLKDPPKYRAEIDKFKELAQDREDYVFAYHHKPEEAPVEEPKEEVVEEPTEEPAPEI